MHKFLVFLLLPFSLFAQDAPLSTNFSVSGTVTGLPDSTLVYLVKPGTTQMLATDYSKGGRFKLFGNIETPDLYQLAFIGQKQGAEIFLDRSKVTVAGDVKNLAAIKFTGSATHNDFQLYKSRFESLKNRLNTLVGKVNETQPGPARDTLIAQFERARRQVLTAVDAFIKEKPSSPVSPFVVYITSPVETDPDGLENRYNKLAEAAQQSLYGMEINKAITASKVGAVGTQAPDFVQNDTSDVPVALSSFKGKYVLVDFWASWCGPCRMENPAVVAAFNSFKDKNFTILGVSLDQSRDRWLQAIKADNLEWTHVSDLKYWQNAVAQMYHISSIPANMLLDPNGTIIARNLRGHELMEKLQQLLN